MMMILFNSTAWALTGITLNGVFSDWSDKPYLQDTKNDESIDRDISLVKWYPDNASGSLYLYAERSGSGNLDWDFNVNLNGDNGPMTAYVYYKRANTNVSVRLYDSNNNQIWSVSGRWGDSKNTGTKVEFYLPLDLIVSTPSGGYEISTYFKSNNDYAPDQGSITISSVSTGPVFITLGIILLNGVLMLHSRKRKVIA